MFVRGIHVSVSDLRTYEHGCFRGVLGDLPAHQGGEALRVNPTSNRHGR